MITIVWLLPTVYPCVCLKVIRLSESLITLLTRLFSCVSLCSDRVKLLSHCSQCFSCVSLKWSDLQLNVFLEASKLSLVTLMICKWHKKSLFLHIYNIKWFLWLFYSHICHTQTMYETMKETRKLGTGIYQFTGMHATS